jgi:predicted pyridoxine 5'-phosphate oxidase superfamily flavin-nucleotide-binding protein
MTIIRTIEDLRHIYADVTEASVAKVTGMLTPEYRSMIEASPFMALATVGPEGLDCSPRGDTGSCVRVQDPKTLLLPDWRGNNRVDSLMNIIRDPRVALMFLIPGSNTAMRRQRFGRPCPSSRRCWRALRRTGIIPAR